MFCTNVHWLAVTFPELAMAPPQASAPPSARAAFPLKVQPESVTSPKVVIAPPVQSPFEISARFLVSLQSVRLRVPAPLL